MFRPKSFITTSEGILQGETGILPTDCRSTPVVVIMNVLVNDVPTQFTYSIVGKQFLPGYSYNYTVTLDIKRRHYSGQLAGVFLDS